MFTLIRCASCGSPNVKFDTKKEGYNVAKGLVGAALVGAPGALLGTDGKKKSYYHCPDCGLVLSYCMDTQKAIAISEEIERYEETGNEGYLLPIWKERYRNIEWPNPSKESKVSENESVKIEEEILTYLNKIGTIVNYDTMVSYIMDTIGPRYEYIVRDVIQDLTNVGKIAEEEMGETKYLRIVTDINEIRDLSNKNSAPEKAFKYTTEKREEFKELLIEKYGHNNTFSYSELCEFIRTLYNENISEANPYVKNLFVSNLAFEYKEKFILALENDTAYFRTDEEAEILRHEHKRRLEEEERLREKKREEEMRAIGTHFVEFLTSHPEEIFTISEMLDDDVISYVFKVKNIEMSRPRATEILSLLVKDGKLEESVYKKISYFGIPGADERKSKREKYIAACKSMDEAQSENEYKECATVFEELKGYKDSDKRYADCFSRIAEIQEKIEEECIECERKAKESKRRTKRIWIIISILIIVAGICAYIVSTLPDLAWKYYQNGEFEKAYRMYLFIDKIYGDDWAWSDYVYVCGEEYAEQLISEGKDAEAEKIFEEIENYVY